MDYKLDLLEKAASLEKKGKWQELLTFCTAWSEMEPMNLFAWQGIGDSLRKLGKPAEAIPMYYKGLEIAPTHSVDFMGSPLSSGPLWYRLGHAFSELGNYHKAIEAYSEAARIDPEVVDIWNDLGVVYINISPPDVKAAFEAFKKAISLEPSNTNSLRNIGILYARCNVDQGVNQVHQMLSNINKKLANEFWLEARKILAQQ